MKITKKEYDRKRYLQRAEEFRKKYLKNRDLILEKARQKSKTISKINVFEIIDYWSSGFLGYDRHKKLFIFSKIDIDKLKDMIQKRFKGEK